MIRLASDTDVNAKGYDHGSTAFMMASDRDHVEVLMFHNRPQSLIKD